MSRRGGAKRKAGNRTSGGRLSRTQAPDKGSDRVIELRALYVPFQDGKAEQQVFDPIGRAWAVGLLENDLVDPAVLRDAGREYGDGYWCYYPNPKAVACYGGREPRSTSTSGKDGQGEHFRFLDDLLAKAGRLCRDAVISLCVDQYHFPDENQAWLARLINARLLKARKAVVGQLPMAGDEQKLRQAIVGLLALVGRRG
jgi:hypothetical protein